MMEILKAAHSTCAYSSLQWATLREWAIQIKRECQAMRLRGFRCKRCDDRTELTPALVTVKKADAIKVYDIGKKQQISINS